MSEKKRTLMTSTQKAKVALEAVKGSKTVNEIAQEYSVHPTQVGLWKKALLENASQLFDVKPGPKGIDPQSNPERRWCINTLMALRPLTPIVSRQNYPYPNRNRHAQIGHDIQRRDTCMHLGDLGFK